MPVVGKGQIFGSCQGGSWGQQPFNGGIIGVIQKHHRTVHGPAGPKLVDEV